MLSALLAVGMIAAVVPVGAQPKPELKLELKGEKKPVPNRDSLGEFRISLDSPLTLDGPAERERSDSIFQPVTRESRDPSLILNGPPAEGPILLTSERPEAGLSHVRRVVSRDIGSTLTLTAGYIEGNDASKPSDARAIGAKTRLGRWSVYGEFAREETSRLTLDLRNGAAGGEPVRPLLNRTINPGGAGSLRDARLTLPSTDLPEGGANPLDRYYLEAVYSFRPTVQGKVSYQRALIDASTRREDLRLEGSVETGRDTLLKAGFRNQTSPDAREPSTRPVNDKKVWTEFILKF